MYNITRIFLHINVVVNKITPSIVVIEDFIEINKRQKTHHTHTKYTIYIE